MIHSYDKNINRKVRVFVSSTFSDMQYERNIIVNSVFPRLRKEFKRKLIDITEVDLRWGIPEEREENGKVLEICIGEVLRCAPYFVGIIGERYGTTVTEEDIENLPPAYRKALGESVPDGLSITELEMRAGVFVPNNVDFSVFFMKDEIYHSEALEPEVKRLLGNIREGYESHIYKGAVDFEEMLFSSLKEYINKVIPDDDEVPYGDESYYQHLKVLKANNSRYVPDAYFLSGAERRIKSERKLYLQGGKGAGKSATMSRLIWREGVERDGSVFFHYASAASGSWRRDDLFHRMRLYLESLSKYVSREGDDYNAVLDIISSQLKEKSVTIYVDALDKMDDVTLIYKLFDLSRHSNNVSVVVSGTENYSRIMGEDILTLKPLTTDQVSQIVNGTLQRYGKRLSREMKRSVMTNESCTNPLFLSVVLSHLIMYGTYSTLDSFFLRLMEINNFSSLFSFVISRIKEYFLERDVQEEKIDLSLALILYSSSGVTESEMGDIVGILPVARSVLLSSIELFTIEINGLIRFNHDLIEKEAENILLSSSLDYRKIVSSLFISYYEGRDDDWRKYSELSYQLLVSGEKEKLLSFLSKRECFLYLLRYERNSLIGYLSHLVEEQDDITTNLLPLLRDDEKLECARIMCLSGAYKAAIRTAESLIENGTDEVWALSVIARSEYKLARNNYIGSIETYKKLLSLYREKYPDDEIGYAGELYLLGVVYHSAGILNESVRTLEEAGRIYEENDVLSLPSLWVESLKGQNLYLEGRINDALSALEKAISGNKYLFGEFSAELAWAYCYGWNILYALGEKDSAFKMVEDSYRIYFDMYSGRGSKLAWASMNLGTSEMVRGNYNKAESLYKFSIDENDKVLLENERPHVYSLTAYADLALLYETTKRHEEAVETIGFALLNSRRKNGESHIYTANILLNYGIILLDPDAVKKALEIYESKSLHTPDIFFARLCLSVIYLKTGKEEESKRVLSLLRDVYCSIERDTDLITYLILDTVEKVCGDLDDEMMETLDSLYRYDEYTFFMSHNNSSQAFLIPTV